MSEAKEMTIQVITPDGITYDHHGTYVSLRTTYGEMGILPNMIQTIAALDVDEVRIRRQDDKQGQIDYVAVNGGFVEVNDNVVKIVANSAERDRDIDVSRAERAKIRAEKSVEEAAAKHQMDARARAEIALRRALNRIKVAEHIKK